MNPRVRRILVVFSIIAFMVAVLGIASNFQVVHNIPVAAVTIASGDLITADKIATVDVSSSGIYPDQITDKTLVIGKFAQAAIQKGAPFFFSTIANQSASQTVGFLSEEDAGKQVIFVRTDLAHADGNIIQPGSYANLMQVDQTKGVSRIFLEKVHVVGARNADGNAVAPLPPGGTVTSPAQRIAGYLLALNPLDAAYVAGIPQDNLYLLYTTKDAPPLGQLPIEVSIK